MVKITLEVTEELSEKLDKLCGGTHLVENRLPEFLSKSLEQVQSSGSMYRYILDFLASNPTHQQIRDFRPTTEMQERLRALMMASKAGSLTANELNELDEYEYIEHLIIMLKSGNLKFLR